MLPPCPFEWLAVKVLQNLHRNTLRIYLDDKVVFSQNLIIHLCRLKEVFQGFGETQTLKCELFHTRIADLEHMVSRQGVSTDPWESAGSYLLAHLLTLRNG